jgi:anti-sigma regulatory factor (Ser/Thr protein kinase)
LKFFRKIAVLWFKEKQLILSPQNSTLDRNSFDGMIPSSFEKGITLDLSRVEFVKPWGVVGLGLLLAELQGKGLAFEIVLPKKSDVLIYLKRIHFGQLIEELGLLGKFEALKKVNIQEHATEATLIELTRLKYRDDFQARSEQLVHMLQKIGLDEERAYLTVSLIGEAADNIFYHNFGRWHYPKFTGGLLMVQKWPKVNTIEVVVGDFGIGIRASLAEIEEYRNLKTDEEAIRKALETNVTSRPQQRGGNGLPFILRTIQADLRGEMDIRSGDSHLRVNGGTRCLFKGKALIGTMVGLTVNY